MILARETDRDADGEEQAEVGEDRVARRGDRGDVEQVGLAEPQQQAGDRQHRDGQHQRAAHALRDSSEHVRLHRVTSASSTAPRDQRAHRLGGFLLQRLRASSRHSAVERRAIKP